MGEITRWLYGDGMMGQRTTATKEVVGKTIGQLLLSRQGEMCTSGGFDFRQQQGQFTEEQSSVVTGREEKYVVTDAGQWAERMV